MISEIQALTVDQKELPKITSSGVETIKRALKKEGVELEELSSMSFSELLDLYQQLDKSQLPENVVEYADDLIGTLDLYG